MNIRNLAMLALFFLVLTPKPLKAQLEEPKRQIEFSCVSWEKLSYSELFYRYGREFLPLKIRPRNRSDLYPIKPKAAFEIYTRETNENDEISFKLVGQSTLPAGTKRVLFFISDSVSGEELPLKVKGIDDSLEAFPPSSFRFVNFTRIPLQVVFDGDKSVIAPKKMTVVKFKTSSDGGLLPFYIKNSLGAILYENRLFSTPNGRDMIFINPPKTKGGRVSIMLLPR